MPMDELAAMILAVTGKDQVQFAAMFSQGTVVSGSSHVRWDPFTLDPTEVRRLLGRFPDPDPERRFDPGLCTSVVLLGLVQPLTIDREHGSKRRFLKRESFWDKVIALGAATAEYKTYSYRTRADVFAAELGPMGVQVFAEASKLLAFSSYEDQIRRGTVETIEYHVPRPDF